MMDVLSLFGLYKLFTPKQKQLIHTINIYCNEFKNILHNSDIYLVISVHHKPELIDVKRYYTLCNTYSCTHQGRAEFFVDGKSHITGTRVCLHGEMILRTYSNKNINIT